MIICLALHILRVLSSLGLVEIRLPWPLQYKSLYEHWFCGKHLRIEWNILVVDVSLRNCQTVFQSRRTISLPTSKTWEFQLICILPNRWYCFLNFNTSVTGMQLSSHCGFNFHLWWLMMFNTFICTHWPLEYLWNNCSHLYQLVFTWVKSHNELKELYKFWI